MGTARIAVSSIVFGILWSMLAMLATASRPWPIVIWHGMGDTCCDPLSLGYVEEALEKKYGVKVVSLNSGGGSAWLDFASGFWGNANDQVAQACNFLRSQPFLSKGFNLIGFSQGGQFARAIVQRCRHDGLPVKTLITFGAQHQGIVDVPGCVLPADHPPTGFCKVAMKLLGHLAYLPVVRSNVIQAQYVKAPGALQQYRLRNPFLPDLNNEVEGDWKAQYRDNLLALDRLALVRFNADITVVPRDSAWFSWYNGSHLVPLEQQRQYSEDWLGLRTLAETGRLHFDELPGMHMQFSMAQLLAKLERYMSFEN